MSHFYLYEATNTESTHYARRLVVSSRTCISLSVCPLCSLVFIVIIISIDPARFKAHHEASIHSKTVRDYRKTENKKWYEDPLVGAFLIVLCLSPAIVCSEIDEL